MASVPNKRSKLQVRSYAGNGAKVSNNNERDSRQQQRKMERAVAKTSLLLTAEQRDVYEWMLSDLKRSGLTDEDIVVKPYTKEESAALGLWKTSACYTIQYHDEHGKPIDMLRARWRPATSGFEKLVKQKDKYAQPDGTGCESYLSRRVD